MFLFLVYCLMNQCSCNSASTSSCCIIFAGLKINRVHESLLVQLCRKPLTYLDCTLLHCSLSRSLIAQMQFFQNQCLLRRSFSSPFMHLPQCLIDEIIHVIDEITNNPKAYQRQIKWIFNRNINIHITAVHITKLKQVTNCTLNQRHIYTRSFTN